MNIQGGTVARRRHNGELGFLRLHAAAWVARGDDHSGARRGEARDGRDRRLGVGGRGGVGLLEALELGDKRRKLAELEAARPVGGV